MPSSRRALIEAQRAFHSTFVPAHRGRIRVVATDVDGTLTSAAGMLRPVALEALARLRAVPDPPTLVLVTGRTAACVQALLLYTGFGHCPIIAENGAVVVPRLGATPHVVAPFRLEHTDAVWACMTRAGCGARAADDNADHLSDMTFVPDAAGAPSPEALARLAAELEAALAAPPPELGLPPMDVLYSTVHVHVGAAGVNKGRTLAQLLAGDIPGCAGTLVPASALVCLGDSPNDASMFTTFPAHAIAVPGSEGLHPGLVHCARYAAPAAADEGFAAVMEALFPDA